MTTMTTTRHITTHKELQGDQEQHKEGGVCHWSESCVKYEIQNESLCDDKVMKVEMEMRTSATTLLSTSFQKYHLNPFLLAIKKCDL
jgi:hypothetical protein